MRRLGLIRPRDLVPSHSCRKADRCWPSPGLCRCQRRCHRKFSGLRVVPEPEERDDDATKWLRVGVVIDRGCDGWSACYMLDSWCCNIMGLHDPNHGIWNDCMLGIRDAGLYSWVLVTLAVIGPDHGPWKNFTLVG